MHYTEIDNTFDETTFPSRRLILDPYCRLHARGMYLLLNIDRLV